MFTENEFTRAAAALWERLAREAIETGLDYLSIIFETPRRIERKH